MASIHSICSCWLVRKVRHLLLWGRDTSSHQLWWSAILTIVLVAVDPNDQLSRPGWSRSVSSHVGCWLHSTKSHGCAWAAGQIGWEQSHLADMAPSHPQRSSFSRSVIFWLALTSCPSEWGISLWQWWWSGVLMCVCVRTC